MFAAPGFLARRAPVINRDRDGRILQSSRAMSQRDFEASSVTCFWFKSETGWEEEGSIARRLDCSRSRSESCELA